MTITVLVINLIALEDPEALTYLAYTLCAAAQGVFRVLSLKQGI